MANKKFPWHRRAPPRSSKQRHPPTDGDFGAPSSRRIALSLASPRSSSAGNKNAPPREAADAAAATAAAAFEAATATARTTARTTTKRGTTTKGGTSNRVAPGGGGGGTPTPTPPPPPPPPPPPSAGGKGKKKGKFEPFERPPSRDGDGDGGAVAVPTMRSACDRGRRMVPSMDDVMDGLRDPLGGLCSPTAAATAAARNDDDGGGGSPFSPRSSRRPRASSPWPSASDAPDDAPIIDAFHRLMSCAACACSPPPPRHHHHVVEEEEDARRRRRRGKGGGLLADDDDCTAGADDANVVPARANSWPLSTPRESNAGARTREIERTRAKCRIQDPGLASRIAELEADLTDSNAKLRALEERCARAIDEAVRARWEAEATSAARAGEMRELGARLKSESRLVDELRSRITHLKIEIASSNDSAAAALAAARRHPKEKARGDDGEMDEELKRLKDEHSREGALRDAIVAELKSQLLDATARCERLEESARRAREEEEAEEEEEKRARARTEASRRGGLETTDAPRAEIARSARQIASSAAPAAIADRGGSPGAASAAPVIDDRGTSFGPEEAAPPPADERPGEVPVVAATGSTEGNTVHDETSPEWARRSYSSSGRRVVGDDGVDESDNAGRDGDIDEDGKSLVVVHHHNKDEEAHPSVGGAIGGRKMGWLRDHHHEDEEAQSSSVSGGFIGGRKMGWLRGFAMSAGLCDAGLGDDASLVSSTVGASVQSESKKGRWQLRGHRQRSESLDTRGSRRPGEITDDDASGIADSGVDASGTTDDDASGTTDDDASAADDGTCENSECSSLNVNSFDSRIEFQELGSSISNTSSGTGANKSQDIGDAPSKPSDTTVSIRSSTESESESARALGDDSKKTRSWFSTSGWSKALNYHVQREGRDEIEERGAESDPVYGRHILLVQ